MSSGEIFVGAVAVLAPYFDHRGSVVGSVGIYGPSARVDEQKMLEYSRLARKAGREISALLGFPRSARDQNQPELNVRRHFSDLALRGVPALRRYC